MATKIYDVIVVGSGASGGWVAKELTEKGVEVLMLEAGPPRVPTRDFTEHIWPYQLKYRGFGNQKKNPNPDAPIIDAVQDDAVQWFAGHCSPVMHHGRRHADDRDTAQRLHAPGSCFRAA